MKKYIEHLNNCIQNAEMLTSSIEKTSGILKIDGMSSHKVRHFLNNLCGLDDARYLEVGTWKGSTLLSAIYKNFHCKATCIENFSDFGGPKSEFLNNVQNFKSNTPSFQFLEQDCFSVSLKNLEKKNIYFFDGLHTEADHEKAFTYFNEILDDTFICAVDDWNFGQVVSGTKKAFKNLSYNILFEKVLPAARNGDTAQWWNGLYVAVIQK